MTPDVSQPRLYLPSPHSSPSDPVRARGENVLPNVTEHVADQVTEPIASNSAFSLCSLPDVSRGGKVGGSENSEWRENESDTNGNRKGGMKGVLHAWGSSTKCLTKGFSFLSTKY